jgi:two-component system response regulator AtoC
VSSKGSILVVDDEKLIRWSLEQCLQEAGYEVTVAENAAAALDALASHGFDLILLDFNLPDIDGLTLLARIHADHPESSVIMVTAHSNIENAVAAMRAGASDYLAKPFRNEDIVLRVSKALDTGRLEREVRRLRDDQLQRIGGQRMIIGSSPSIKRVFQVLDRIIHSADATILIQGESGTGKDVLAKAIHYGGPRRAAPYVNITCTALPDSLLESELFGHEKGAFTDAKVQKKGLVEVAEGGTLFLDEIGDMSQHLQGKLLRFLEERTFRRVGGDRDRRVNVRVIAATNRDLKEMVAKKEFREDLYFRLKVIPIQLPPLRERREDIPVLTDYFIQEFNRDLKRTVKGATPSLTKRLEEYHWPGNIRELRNTIERAMILSSGEILDEDDLPLDLFDEPSSKPVAASRIKLTKKGVQLEEIEKDLVTQALELTRGNQTQAGKLLGLNRDQVRYRIEKFGLPR